MQAQTAASAANAKPVSPQALAEIVAAAKGVQQAAAAVPENLLKMPAGAQIAAAGETPAKPSDKDASTAAPRVSVTMKSNRDRAACRSSLTRPCARFPDIAANESQASELSDKTEHRTSWRYPAAGCVARIAAMCRRRMSFAPATQPKAGRRSAAGTAGRTRRPGRAGDTARVHRRSGGAGQCGFTGQLIAASETWKS